MRVAGYLLALALQVAPPVPSSPARPTMTTATMHIAVKGSASPAEVAPGSRVTLAFDITPGRRMHVYAPGADYQVISVTLDPNPAAKAHDTVYPPSEIYFFEPLNEKVPVYQKAFKLTRDVTIGDTRQAATVTLTGKLEYQACDDKVCFKPNAIPFKFELKVKAADRPN